MEKSKTDFNYAEAMAEVEQILSQLNAEKVSVDELEQKVRRASLLIEQCRAKLRSVESGVSALLEEEV